MNTPAHSSPSASADNKRPSLLFIDDEPTILTALRVVFRSGYQVSATTDGFEAIEWMKSKHFDVIVSDQRMPTIQGVEVLRQARELCPQSIRVLLTGYSDTDAVVGAINDVEVHRFLQKPWDNRSLKQQVDEAIDLSVRIQNTPDMPSADTVQAAAPSAALKTAKETVLIADTGSNLFTTAKKELSDKVNLLHASNMNEVFEALQKHTVGVLVCAFDVQSETDHTFLQMLKQEHPYILVVAVCDSVDSTHLIELINHARIFRFVKNPVSWPLLNRYVMSAAAHADEIKRHPVLVLRQNAEGLPETAKDGSLAQMLRTKFESTNKSLLSQLAKLTGWFQKKS